MKHKKSKTLTKGIFVAVYLAVIAVCIALDQLTKQLIFENLLHATPGESVNVLGKFLRFYAVYNEGASFGMGKSDAANIVFFIITVLGTPVFCFMLWRSRTRSVCGQVGFAFIVGGTIGNAIDRAFVQTDAGKFFSGKVRDFISFSIFPPIFNIADSFLVIGTLLAVVAILFADSDALFAPSARKAQEDAQGANQSCCLPQTEDNCADGEQSSNAAENHSATEAQGDVVAEEPTTEKSENATDNGKKGEKDENR